MLFSNYFFLGIEPEVPRFQPDPKIVPGSEPPVINGFVPITGTPARLTTPASFTTPAPTPFSITSPLTTPAPPTFVSTTLAPVPAVPFEVDYYEDDQSYVPSYYAPTYEPPPLYYDEPQELEVFETLPAETSLIDPNLQCYERTCDQNITGKNEYIIN